MMAWSEEDRAAYERPAAATSGTGDEGLVLHGTKTGRLAQSGPPMRDMQLERNRDYPADSDLCFERGQYKDRIRMTAGDLHVLRALLTAGGDLQALRDKAARWMRDALEEVDPDADEWALRVGELVIASHAAGYRLSGDDIRATCEDAAMVADRLADLAQSREGDFDPEQPQDGRHNGAVRADQAAIERVIALLRSER